MKALRWIALLAALPLALAGCALAGQAVRPTAPPTAVAAESSARPTAGAAEAAPLAAPTAVPTPSPTPVPASQAPRSTQDRLERLGGRACPDDSQFTCITLTVPLDHFDAGNAATLSVSFAVLPASGRRAGMFVVAVGGPGASGIAEADSYTASYDPSIAEHFDIVFFDQRGVGASGGIECPEAAAAYYVTQAGAATAAEEAGTIAAARTFAEDCIRQIKRPDLLPYLGTAQAVEDLEAFRAALGQDKLWLYGESYGTQFAQTYAAAHGDRLAAMILDGTVDLTRTGIEYATGATLAFEAVLSQTLAACMTDETCAGDMGGDAAAAYDALVARTERQPAPVTFPLASGKTARRQLTRGDLSTATAGYLNSPDARMILLRALAYSARGDLAAMARLVYSSLGADPETLEIQADPTYSDAAYYAVTCNDYQYFTGRPADRAAAFMRAGAAVASAAPRLSTVFYSELPCVFWPAGPGGAARPAPLAAPGIPTLVLGATADPLTPLADGQRVFSRLADGYLITTEGGAHVTFARGNACPDDLVTAFLVQGDLPAQRETTCDGAVIDAYAPIPPVNASAYADPLQAMQAAEREIAYLPDYYYWDGVTRTSVGCSHGGSMTFEALGKITRLELKNCAFSKGLVLNGTGEDDVEADRFTLEVTASGLARGKLSYTREADEARVTGAYAGKPVDLAATRP